MQLKDHYRILEVAPRATLQEIKQAYRRLAHQYHPDKNQSTFASARFQELQEAYNILSHADKRRKYDEERWLSGMGNRATDQRIVTAEWILQEATKLKDHVAAADTYRMSKSALYDYVQLLLSDPHMAILQQQGDKKLNTELVDEILHATASLKTPYTQQIAIRLVQLAGSNDTLAQYINDITDSRLKAEQRDNMMPYIAVAITVFLCLLMYLYGRSW